MPASHDPADAAFGSARISPQRREIVSAVEALTGAFTVEELARTTHARDASIGTATVYRAVAALEASRWLERVGERDGSALFARCQAGAHHHHHVVCERCGRVEVTQCPVEIAAAENPDGFRITRHEVTLYGLCPSCSASGTGVS
ncbi:MAG: transcriptional repressor [Coriobacteriia bacterium]|nr:transcriptional repressor [Coriobacteriia bacterium]